MLRVMSIPPNAEVLLDGRSAGHTPLLIKDVSPGTRNLELRLKGWKVDKRQVTVKSGQPKTVVEVELKALPGILRISKVHTGDKVRILPSKGKSPPVELQVIKDGKIDTKALVPGAYRVTVERKAFDLGRFQVVIPAGGLIEIAAPIGVDRRGTLAVEAYPEGTAIGGAVTGTSPVRTRLLEGSHTFTLSHPAAGKITRTVKVRRGKVTLEKIDLWAVRGANQLKAGRLAEAEEAFIRAGKSERTRGLIGVASAWIEQADKRLNAGDAAAALKAAKQSARLRPADPETTGKVLEFV